MKWNDIDGQADRLLKSLLDQEEETDMRLNEIRERFREEGYLAARLRNQESYDYLSACRRLPRHSSIRIFRPFLRLTAVLALLLTAGGLGVLFLGKTEPSGRTGEPWTDISPGERKAVLVKSDGQKVTLEDRGQFIMERHDLQIQADSTGLHYEVLAPTGTENALQHTLSVPRGGEYSLTLADGTQVWLNSESELHYPVTFSVRERVVTVHGEAYFRVARDEGRPFTVRTEKGDIRVWGTEFNVRSYTGSSETVTTLVSGSISYRLPDGQEIYLKESQELRVDAEGDNVLSDVDTRYATGWKDGKFLFQEKSLEELLGQLERWYDIEVSYRDPRARDLHFSGDLNRYRDIGTFIHMFEQSSDLRFTFKDGRLTVGFREK